MTAPKLTLDRQLQSLALAVVAQQRALDESWRDDAREFLPVWRLAQAGGLGALARAIAPLRIVATEATIDVRLFVARERASALTVRLAGLGLQKRYERTTQAQLQLRCTLTARPCSSRRAAGA